MENGQKKLIMANQHPRVLLGLNKPSWFTKGSDLKNIFESLVVNGLNDDQATKIVGTNWFDFMKNHF